LGWTLWVPERRRKGPIIIAIVVVVVLAAGGVGIWLLLDKPWESKGEKYAATIKCSVDNAEEQKVCDAVRARYAAMVDGDTGRMRELTCSKGRPYDLEDYQAEIKAFQKAFEAGDLRLSLTKIDIKGDKAPLTLRLQMGSETGTIKAEWAKENGQWKACSEAQYS
jgi:hypothetical protein